MKRLVVIILLLIPLLKGFSQELNNTTLLAKYEDTLKVLGKKVLHAKSDSDKIGANQEFLRLLETALLQPNSFTYPFDSLTSIARLTAPDNSFRMFNWSLFQSNGTYHHYGYIQLYNKKKKTYEVISLIDKSSEIKKPEQAVLEPNNWYGTHYYKIILTKHKKKKYYTLLGINWNDLLTRKKVIDVLYFTEEGKPKFGDAIFKSNSKLRKRVIFEYSAELSMSLKYDEDQKKIIFDHLSPLNGGLKGQYQYYGPDFTYDAFEFKKGKWNYLENIEIRNKKTSQDNNYNQP